MTPAPLIRYAARAVVLHDGHVLLIRSRRPGGDHFILRSVVLSNYRRDS